MIPHQSFLTDRVDLGVCHQLTEGLTQFVGQLLTPNPDVAEQFVVGVVCDLGAAEPVFDARQDIDDQTLERVLLCFAEPSPFARLASRIARSRLGSATAARQARREIQDSHRRNHRPHITVLLEPSEKLLQTLPPVEKPG